MNTNDRRYVNRMPDATLPEIEAAWATFLADFKRDRGIEIMSVVDWRDVKDAWDLRLRAVVAKRGNRTQHDAHERVRDAMLGAHAGATDTYLVALRARLHFWIAQIDAELAARTAKANERAEHRRWEETRTEKAAREAAERAGLRVGEEYRFTVRTATGERKFLARVTCVDVDPRGAEHTYYVGYTPTTAILEGECAGSWPCGWGRARWSPEPTNRPAFGMWIDNRDGSPLQPATS